MPYIWNCQKKKNTKPKKIMWSYFGNDYVVVLFSNPRIMLAFNLDRQYYHQQSSIDNMHYFEIYILLSLHDEDEDNENDEDGDDEDGDDENEVDEDKDDEYGSEKYKDTEDVDITNPSVFKKRVMKSNFRSFISQFSDESLAMCSESGLCMPTPEMRDSQRY